MSAKMGVVEDTNAETKRIRKIIASRRIDDDPSPQQLYNKHWFFLYRNSPLPNPPSNDLLIFKGYNTLW